MSACRWIPWTVVGALGVVVTVNCVMAFFAVSSSTGLVTAHPFESGNGYNQVLEAAAREDRLGWHGSVRLVGRQARSAEISALLTDRSGRPLTGLSVVATIVSPVDPLPDSQLPLREIEPGRYSGAATLTRLGQWDVHVSARRGTDRYAFVQRVVLR